jgi:hypothetical protein
LSPPPDGSADLVEAAVSLEDYALNLVLVAVVIRQIRGRKLTVVGLLWPIGLVLYAGVKYLHGVPTAGNDVALVILGGLAGATLGCLCGLLTRIRRLPDDSLVANATAAAALLWVLGVGARMGFAIFASNGGGPTVARFSAAHHITSAAAWTACLLVMALAEVLGRTALLATRGLRIRSAATAST